MEQRRFALMGQNLFIILSKFIRNQTICKLLYYTDKNPLSTDKADIDGLTLIHKNLLVVPKIPDDLKTKENFIVVTFKSFHTNPSNKEFKVGKIQVAVVCPFEEWVLDTNSLRPYLLMQEIDKELNEQKINGIGTLNFINAQQLTLSPQLGGFSMEYQNNDFN